MTINGSNFTTDATTTLGATPLATTYVSPVQLTAAVPATLVAIVSTASVQVSTPNGTSSPDAPMAAAPPPTVTSLSPSTAVGGGAAFTLTISGTNFANNSVANWGSTPLTTTYVSSTRLTASVPASLIATAGTDSITVTTVNGTSTGLNFIVTQPPPVISDLSPSTIVGDGPALTLTINGSNFLPGISSNVARWNSTTLTTTYVSPTQLTAVVPSTLIGNIGTANISVVTAGKTSASFSVTVIAPVPVIVSMSLSQVPAGFGTFGMYIYGKNMPTSATVNWGATQLAASGIGSGTLAVVVPGSLVANVGTVNITMTTAGGTSNALVFKVTTPQPQITSLSPASIAAGSAALTVTINGANFTPISQVFFNSTQVSVTYISSTQLTSVIPSNLLATAHTTGVEIYTPGGPGWSSVSNFSVSPAPPAIGSLSPASVTAGYAGFMLTINGKVFTTDSTCFWGTTPLYTVYVSPTQLRVEVPSSLVQYAGTANITIASSAGVSALSVFTINQAPPQITTFAPAILTAGGAGFTLALNGGYFTSTSIVDWGSTALTTTYISSTQLTAAVPANLIASAGTIKITVVSAAGTSPPATFFVNPPPRILTTMLPMGTAGANYSGTVNVTGGVPGYIWSVTGLPETMSFSNTFDSDLVISGKPASSGIITIQVSAEDMSGAIAGPVTLTINVGSGANGVGNGALNGRYACLLQGFFDGDNSRWASLLSFEADGQGNITSGIIDTNSHEVGSASGTVTSGSYTLSADSSGFATIQTELTNGAAGIQTTQWAISAAAATLPAQHFHMVEADDLGTLPSGQHGTGDCYLATTSAFTASTISGTSFVFGLDGENKSGTLEATTGMVSALSEQRISGYLDMAIGGSTTVQDMALTGSYTTPDSVTGRATILLADSGYPTGYTVYVIDANRMLILDNSSNNGEQAGNMRRQQQTTYSAANVDGPFVLYTRGAEFSGSGNTPSGFYANIFEATGSGTGSLTVRHSYGDDDGTYSATNSSSTPMALTFDSNYSGRARFASANGTTYLYLFDQNSGFAMNVQMNGSLDSGWLENQTQTAFTNATLAGNYLFGELSLLNLQSNGDIGETNATNTGAISGTYTTAGQGYLSWDQSLSATYTWDAAAAGTGSFLVANSAQGASSCTVVSATKFVCVSQSDAAPSVEVIEQ
jgi:hypothetical protein